MSGSMFFDSWTGLARVVITGLPAYFALVFWLRLSGKRTLSKWNAFDFVVTIALGSVLATLLLSKDVAFVEGVVAIMLLIGLQFAITWISIRSSMVRRIVKSQPTLLVDRGTFLHESMRGQRVTESEIYAAVRAAGIVALEDVEAVVLETDGSFSVMKLSQTGLRSALSDVVK